MVARTPDGVNTCEYHPQTMQMGMQIDLRESWRIRDVEIPTRLVLAPMAGVSVQAFRRQGRRFGAGLVCSEMVSCAGIEHRNEKTLGYLRVAADEHPLAIQIFGSEPRAMAEAARMVEDAGADLVDINFGCPVRKVTKTGAGATLLDEPDRACAIVEAVAGAVSVPVSVKMRRGLRDGARTCLEVGPKLVEAGAATLTLHPRSAQQMYTGVADHALTAELVSLVDVPVIASGDIVSRAKAQAVLATTGAEAVMVGRGAQGNPWLLREIMEGDGREPTREEVVAELVLFIRETVRELGERRASGFLKKFYGWYLGRGRFPRPFKQELVVLDSTEEVERLLIAAAPGALPLLERLEDELPSRRRDPARPADLDLRRRLGVPEPDEPEALEREVGVDAVEGLGVRGDQVGEAARGDRLGLDSELLADLRDDPVHLACEPVDEAGLEAADGRLADHGRRRGEVDLDEPGGAGEQRLHRDLDPGREHAAHVIAFGRDDVEVRRRAEVDDDAGRAVALLRRDSVDDPVRPDLARVVVANRDARLHSGPDRQDRRAGPPLRDALPLALERRHGGGETDAVDVFEIEQRGERDAQLVAGPAAVGREPEAVDELVAAIQAEDRLRIADVDGQQHGGCYGPSSSVGRRSPRRSASDSAVSFGSSPSPRSSSIVTSLEV